MASPLKDIMISDSTSKIQCTGIGTKPGLHGNRGTKKTRNISFSLIRASSFLTNKSKTQNKISVEV